MIDRLEQYIVEKKGVAQEFITFWSSDQASPFRVSNIILTTNMLTLMIRHISRCRFSFFFDILGRVRSLTLTAEVCTYTYRHAFEQCRIESIYICIIIIWKNIRCSERKKRRRKSLLSGANEKERENLNCPSHHISFVWYWTTFSMNTLNNRISPVGYTYGEMRWNHCIICIMRKWRM